MTHEIPDAVLDVAPEIITHEEAREIVIRMCNSHFDNLGEHMRASIPADPKRDDDLRLAEYIRQQEAKDAIPSADKARGISGLPMMPPGYRFVRGVLADGSDQPAPSSALRAILHRFQNVSMKPGGFAYSYVRADELTAALAELAAMERR